jgi:hypothetical protein
MGVWGACYLFWGDLSVIRYRSQSRDPFPYRSILRCQYLAGHPLARGEGRQIKKTPSGCIILQAMDLPYELQ